MSSTAIASILARVAKPLKNRLEREYLFFKGLKKAGLTSLKNDSKSIYFHCLLELEQIDHNFFLVLREPEIEAAFLLGYHYSKLEDFERAIDSNLHTNPRLRSLKGLKIRPQAVIQRVVDLYKKYVFEAAPDSEKEILKSVLGIDNPVKRNRLTSRLQHEVAEFRKDKHYIPRKLRILDEESSLRISLSQTLLHKSDSNSWSRGYRQDQRAKSSV